MIPVLRELDRRSEAAEVLEPATRSSPLGRSKRPPQRPNEQPERGHGDVVGGEVDHGVAEVVAPGSTSRVQQVEDRHERSPSSAAAASVSRRAPTPRHNTSAITGIDDTPAAIPNTNPNTRPASTAARSADRHAATRAPGAAARRNTAAALVPGRCAPRLDPPGELPINASRHTTRRPQRPCSRCAPARLGAKVKPHRGSPAAPASRWRSRRSGSGRRASGRCRRPASRGCSPRRAPATTAARRATRTWS